MGLTSGLPDEPSRARQRFLTGLKTAGIFAGSSMLSLLTLVLVLELDVLGLTPLTPAGYADVRELARRAAAEHGRPFDGRSVVDVILESRGAGRMALPTIGPAYYLEDVAGSKVASGARPVLPLGMPRLSRTYYCNESGSYVPFDTDRYGFRNPDSVWDEPAIDLLIVGDSFAMGSCLPEPNSIVGRLRSHLPRVINLGMGGNGPLIELAGIREFVPVVKPRAVLWMFFENDLEDLQRERTNPILSSYLQDQTFRQRLVEIAEDVSRAAEQAAEEYFKRARAADQAAGIQPAWYHLPRTRALLESLRTRLATTPLPLDPALLLSVLSAASSESEANGASFLLVYVPDCSRSSYRQIEWRESLLNGLTQRGIETLDLTADIDRVRQAGEDPYYFCPGSHFSEAGTAIAARRILGRLGQTAIGGSKLPPP